MLAYVLTLGRLVLAAVFAACVAMSVAADGSPTPAWAAALLALAAAAELTDMLDGMAARAAGTASRLGGLLDPLCDSLARLTMYFAVALVGWVGLAVPLVMVGRDLVVAYVRTVRAHVAATTSARSSGKIKAIVQGGALLAIILAAGGGQAEWSGPTRLAAAIAVIVVTGWSLVDYLVAAAPAIAQLYRAGHAGGNPSDGPQLR